MILTINNITKCEFRYVWMTSKNGLKDKGNSNNIEKEGIQSTTGYTGAPGQEGRRKLLN